MTRLIWSNVIDMDVWEEQLQDMHPDVLDAEEKLSIAKGYNDDEYNFIVRNWDCVVEDLMAVGVIEFDDGYKTGYEAHMGNNLANIFKCKGAEVAEWVDDNGVVGKFEYDGYSMTVRYYVKQQNKWVPVINDAYIIAA